ncbi:TPA: hypothetical protein I9786_002064 [Serratia marcescens]|nr:hypothetical protein [Serratia marcescens]HAT5031703.1 hypothetical protein [Serratia marcescens]
MFAAKKATDQIARQFGLGRRGAAEFQIDFRQVLVLRAAVFIHRPFRRSDFRASVARNRSPLTLRSGRRFKTLAGMPMPSGRDSLNGR